MRIAPCLALARACVGAAIENREFVPTPEWQFVPENVAVPGGLEIRMDMAEGGRWARVPPGAGASNAGESGEAEVSVDVAPAVDISTVDLDALEEKAPGYDDGADIAHAYGPALLGVFVDPASPNSDQAGRILGICLRNNDEAARVLAQKCPTLPDNLGLDKRSLLIASALVSTQDGLAFAKQTRLLWRLRHTLGSPAARSVDAAAAAALRKLLVSMVVSGEDGEDMCAWANALQQAAYTTKHADLKQLALEIVEHRGEFAGLTVQCAPQPGLLPVQHEAKRAEATASRLQNAKARRNHFEEL